MKDLLLYFFLPACLCLEAPGVVYGQSVSERIPQFPGERTTWKGFVRSDFGFSGRACRIDCHEKLASENFHNCRGGLAASAAVFSNERRGRVAFLGGSITFNHGWRDSVCNYIKKQFPGTSFEFINAGIPSFGSLPDAFRVYQDVLSKGKIRPPFR